MKKIKSGICKLFLAALLFVPMLLNAQDASQPNINSLPNIVMSVSSEREVTPDELYLSITIKESDYKGKKTLEDMQEAMIGVLKVNRIDIPEVLTLDFMGSSVSYKVFGKMKPKTQAKYILKLNDAGIMQKIVYDLENIGISNIELAETKYTKGDELITQLGVEALKKAQERAKVYAASVGQEVGKALSINSYNYVDAVQPRRYKSRALVTVEDAVENSSVASQPIISVSKLTYKVEVNVRFLLQ